MKLLLADDHSLFRDALAQYIKTSEPNTEILIAKNVNETLDLIENSPDLDLIVVDYKMPGMGGVTGIEKIVGCAKNIPVALLSGIANPIDVERAFEKGIIGYFPKTLSGKDVLYAIHQVLSGKKYIPKDSSNENIMPSHYSDGADSSSSEIIKSAAKAQKLTPRETEVLSYLLKGASNKEIANSLDVELVTVKLHVRGICKKLNAKNRTQAALIAKELGLTGS
jgi:DNA-binding NarL/FixJ family response regulator